jgi:uncharacterized membrane protein
MRKELKKLAKSNLKKHYAWILILCIFASFFGIEYGSSAAFSLNTDRYLGIFTSPVSSSVEQIESDESDSLSIISIAKKISEGKKNEVRKEIEAREQKLRNEGSSKILSRRKGLISSMMNSYSAGDFRYHVILAFMNISGSKNFAIAMMILVSLAFYLFVWLFIKESYRIVMRRMILEGRIYRHLSMQRFLFPYVTKSWPQIAWNMFVTSLYKFLWSFTVVGGIIKSYSYAMVPYILAENPKLKANQTITLSRRMMKGHKWELFVADLSFLGWDILDVFTVGISGLLFSNPYKAAFYGEYYARRREEVKNEGMEGADLLCDVYLYEKAKSSLLEEQYPEITQGLMDGTLRSVPKLTGVTAFLSKWFGFILVRNENLEAYEKNQAMQYQLQLGQAILDGEAYPGRLAPSPMKYKLKTSFNMNPNRSYSLLNLIYIFFIMSFIGWLWEVSIHLVEDGIFVNRGVLQGPWLPIYGAGSILVLLLLKRLRNHPMLQFFATMAVCGTVEYSTSWLLEKFFDGQRWWNYSGYFLNIDGRVCAEGLILFGLGGLAIVYVLAPMLDNILKQVNTKALFLVALMLLGAFTFDQIYSSNNPNTGKGISSGGTKKVAMRIIESASPASTTRKKRYA